MSFQESNDIPQVADLTIENNGYEGQCSRDPGCIQAIRDSLIPALVRKLLVTVKDFPKQGVIYKDFYSLVKYPAARDLCLTALESEFRKIINNKFVKEVLSSDSQSSVTQENYQSESHQLSQCGIAIAAVEASAWTLAFALADRLKIPCYPIRKVSTEDLAHPPKVAPTVLRAPVAKMSGISHLRGENNVDTPSTSDNVQKCSRDSKFLEISRTDLRPDEKIVFVDDLVATGNTLRAARILIEEKAQAKMLAVLCPVDLFENRPEDDVDGVPVHSVVRMGGQ